MYPDWPYPETFFRKKFQDMGWISILGYGILTGHILKSFSENIFRIWDGYGFQDMVRGPSMVELSALSLVRKSDRSGSRYGILTGHILKMFSEKVFRIWDGYRFSDMGILVGPIS